MVARVGIFGAMLLSCITCASVLLRRVSAQTSPVSPQQQQVEDKPTKKERWTVAGVSAGVSLLGAALSFFCFRKNVTLSKQIADRTVTVLSPRKFYWK